MTTETSSLPLALARRAAEATRMAKAAADLEECGEAVTARAVAAAAHISREHRLHLATPARDVHEQLGNDVISSALWLSLHC